MDLLYFVPITHGDSKQASLAPRIIFMLDICFVSKINLLVGSTIIFLSEMACNLYYVMLKYYNIDIHSPKYVCPKETGLADKDGFSPMMPYGLNNSFNFTVLFKIYSS